MARTLNLRLAGRAAATELADFRDFLGSVADPNSYYWRLRRDRAISKFDASCWQIWDSPFVPDPATFETHAEFAEAIIHMMSGK